MKKIKRKLACILLSLAVGASLLASQPLPALAAVGYLDNVTSAMSKSSYWSDKMREPDRVLADMDQIQALNKKLVEAQGTNLIDLAAFSKTSYDAEFWGASLKAGAESDAAYLFSQGSRYDAQGKRYSSWESLYGPMIDNCVDTTAAGEMPVQYGIITTRCTIQNFPSDAPLWDDPADPDFDNMFQTALRVNEPVIIRGRSNDQKYCHVRSDCSSGWVSLDNVAICKDREEWLDAWNFAPDQTLIVYGDKITTETSNFSPQISKRTLPMGTCLKLADKSEWTSLINNRTAHNNHVVWMPVRKDDGSYEKKLALISEHCKVSEGFLPLTSANLAMVALEYLGNCYGWGGMLDSEDCSGYVRDVYKCFGLNLARNTTWQENQPVKKYKMADFSGQQQKEDLIRKLPVGSVLIFNGHEMIYLGCDDPGTEDQKLFVISSVSKIVPESSSSAMRIRNTIINTLDVRRASGVTWLNALTMAQVPWLDQDAQVPDDDYGVKTGNEEPEPDPKALQEELDQAKENLGKSQEDLGKTQEELTRSQEELGKSQEELAKSQEELGKSREELTKSQEELGKSQEELGKTQEELGKSQEELGKTQEELTRSQEENEEVLKELEKAQKELDDNDAKVTELEEKLTRAREELTRAQEKAADTARVETIEKRLSDINEQLKRANEEGKALKSRVEELQTQTGAVAQDTKELKKEVKKAVVKAPARVKIKFVKTKKKALKITWKKVKGAGGYQIEIATNKKFTKNRKLITIKKGSKKTFTIKKLKKKKKYYIRIRAYKKVEGGKVTGNWSKKKSKKTR